MDITIPIPVQDEETVLDYIKHKIYHLRQE